MSFEIGATVLKENFLKMKMRKTKSEFAKKSPTRYLNCVNFFLAMKGTGMRKDL